MPSDAWLLRAVWLRLIAVYIRQRRLIFPVQPARSIAAPRGRNLPQGDHARLHVLVRPDVEIHCPGDNPVVVRQIAHAVVEQAGEAPEEPFLVKLMPRVEATQSLMWMRTTRNLGCHL